jgi:hypothetical protein
MDEMTTFAFAWFLHIPGYRDFPGFLADETPIQLGYGVGMLLIIS